MSHANLRLKGQYRLQVFDKNDQLVSDSNYLDNIITNTGLMFPFDIAFADCFRYLSIGTGQAEETVNDMGLEFPINDYTYLGPYRAVNSNVAPGSITPDMYYVPEGCGTTLQTGTVELYRSWRIPSGAGFFEQDYSIGDEKINELMVSPSAPIETGMYAGGSGRYLPFAPTGHHLLAFSRITIPGGVGVKIGDYAIVSYKLSVSPNTQPTFFSGTFNSTNIGQDAGFCSGWSGVISGIGGIVHPGIKLISAAEPDQPTQYDSIAELNDVDKLPGNNQFFGISYTPFLIGAPLEPSCPASVRKIYTSNDNTQFAANPDGGIIPENKTGNYFPFEPTGIISSGICRYQYGLATGANAGYNPFRYIRHNSTKNNISYPSHLDITQATTFSRENKRLNVISKAPNMSNPAAPYITLDLTWPNDSSQKVSAMVMCVEDDQYNDLHPFYDMLLSTTDGRMFPVTYMNNTTGIYDIIEDTTDVKLYFDTINNIDMTFRLSWSRS